MGKDELPDWINELVNEGHSYEDIMNVGQELLLKTMAQLKEIEADSNSNRLHKRLAEIFQSRVGDSSLLFLLKDHFKTISPVDIGLLYYGNRKN